MTWGEVDDDASVWTIPGARMKAGKEHRVPLTPAARALLGERGAPDALVFPSPKDAAKPLSDMALMAVLAGWAAAISPRTASAPPSATGRARRPAIRAR